MNIKVWQALRLQAHWGNRAERRTNPFRGTNQNNFTQFCFLPTISSPRHFHVTACRRCCRARDSARITHSTERETRVLKVIVANTTNPTVLCGSKTSRALACESPSNLSMSDCRLSAKLACGNRALDNHESTFGAPDSVESKLQSSAALGAFNSVPIYFDGSLADATCTSSCRPERSTL